MDKLRALFLAQSYKDSWQEYQASLLKPNYINWDYVILTASDEKQAEGFRMELKERRRFLPKKTKFAVIPDLEGERIGSGGATLNVLRYIKEDSKKHDFPSLKILVIHSGGDSKRIPQYSALGKIFSPVPRMLPDGRPSTLFDELIIATSLLPSRIREGMLLVSGDALLLFNALQVNFSMKDAAVISFKEPKETGKDHGVFVRGEDGNVKKFLHKQTEETLVKNGAVNGNGMVDIDTGAVIFSAELLNALYSLVDTEKKFIKLVNSEVRLSLYGDFLYPLATDSTLEDFYKEQPEGEFSENLKIARKLVFDAISKFKLKLIRLSPAKFLHFGTTHEILDLYNNEIPHYEDLGWSRHVNSSIIGNASGYNGVVSARSTVGNGCYIENSYVHDGVKLGDNVVLSNIDVYQGEIPSGAVVNALKQKNGKFVVRIYGINDNPKTCDGFLGKEFPNLPDLWEKGKPKTLWTAKLYPECDTIKDALKESLNLLDVINGKGDIKRWQKLPRKSLETGFKDADSVALTEWDIRMRDLVRINLLLNGLREGKQAEEVARVFGEDKLSKIQREWLNDVFYTLPFEEKIRLCYYVGVALKGKAKEGCLQKMFYVLSSEIQSAYVNEIKFNENCKIVKDECVVKLPLRVNFGGGWSDTPPYCIENGGKVINAAIVIGGDKPVEVRLKKLKEKKIVFLSRDMDAYGEFTKLNELTNVGDPYDPFALQKACLLACGVLPKKAQNLSYILDRFGGGFIMETEVNNVPKGSGLGTSSILAAACAKAVLEFMGVKFTESDIYSIVLCMEQMMSTGGGWQDQVGGLSEGVKFITSKKGLKQDLSVEHLSLSEETKKELKERFIIIYTGERRLARNLLRDIIGRYLGGEEETTFALNEIKTVAEKMKNALLSGDIDMFTDLMNYHWELSKKIDGGCTNTLIDQIFLSIDEFIDAKFICGAGGGGFLQAVLKKGCTKEQVHERLKKVFWDSDIDVWDAELLF